MSQGETISQERSLSLYQSLLSMEYKKMLEEARDKGLVSEKKMWDSVSGVSGLLDEIREDQPEAFWAFMRKQHGIMYDGCYDETFARHDVDVLRYSDAEGNELRGPHWSPEEIANATAEMAFPTGVNIWDRYVAFNTAYADFCKHFPEEQILQIGYDFYFADGGWKGPSKIWDYMCLRHGRE